ncbi:uncharacterized protein LOC119002432 [Sturnira hondurensis]|uniref:uncharacterized protein LOC119002432 n=1 Tax=Sturnira hondurensis TaxID=192404 RepID=UPI0018798F3B|nr:uncharacterized protein LOC119002432 [Sturnira hondurensis]
MATFDPAMGISPMSDIVTAIKLRRLQRKAKHILFNWLDHYRFSLGGESLHTCKMPKFPQQVIRKQKVSPAEFPLEQSAKEKDENKEYLLNRNTFVKLKGVFKPPPLPRIQKALASNQHFRYVSTSAVPSLGPCPPGTSSWRGEIRMYSINQWEISRLPSTVDAKSARVLLSQPPLKLGPRHIIQTHQFNKPAPDFRQLQGLPRPPSSGTQVSWASRASRLSLPSESKDAWFASHLVCPVVLRRTLCGKEGDSCRCSTYSIPEVTDLEYDYLISKQLSSIDQIIIVCVFSDMEKDKTIKEVAKVYREQNRTRSMPCIQSRSDSFRFLKYNIISASKFTGSHCPLLVRRHNVIPGIFLMYIQGKLLFANFIFNGYSTSAKDLQKQMVKTRSDYHMGYFLPSDFRIRAQSTSCFGNEDILL